MKRYAGTELARNVTVAARGLASRRVDYLNSVRIDTRTNCGGGMLDMRAGWLPAKKAARYCRVAPSSGLTRTPADGRVMDGFGDRVDFEPEVARRASTVYVIDGCLRRREHRFDGFRNRRLVRACAAKLNRHCYPTVECVCTQTYKTVRAADSKRSEYQPE
jgi:hypothetical protein